MKKIFIIISFVFISFCQEYNQKKNIQIGVDLFIYSFPEYTQIQQTNFPIDFIYPDSKVVYFIHLERTGIWTPDQYALYMKIHNVDITRILNYYNSIIKIKQWQILQSKKIVEKNQSFYFINAQDYFNRNLSILIQDLKNEIDIKIYIKKITDE